MSVPFDSAEVVEIAGADALAFAHSQFTSDVAGLAVGSWQFSAWLSAQGRALAVFALLRPQPDRLIAWLPLGGANQMRDALARYVLRAKVQLAVRSDWASFALAELPAHLPERQIIEQDGGFAFAQPGPEPRVAWIGTDTGALAPLREAPAWRLADVAAGLPWLVPALRDEFVAQALDLERIDAIRFDKGCYPGQEIVARLHFRGGSKRSLRRLRIVDSGDALPGTRIRDADADAGFVLYGARASNGDQEALAVLADTAAESARLSVEGAHAVVLPLAGSAL